MITLTIPELFGVFLGFMSLGLAVAYYGTISYLRFRKAKRKQNKFTRNTIDGDRNTGNQWKGKKLVYNAKPEPCKRELLLFATMKDFQNTNNEMILQLRAKDEQLRNKKEIMDRYHEQFLKQECVIERQSLEIDGLRNELNTMKYEQALNRFPLLELKEKVA